MTEHTPGPWQRIGIGIIGTDRQIATVWGQGFNVAEQLANANLIAAAPKLLAACEAAACAIALLRSPLALNSYGWEEINDATAAIRSAIAKAKGETE